MKIVIESKMQKYKNTHTWGVGGGGATSEGIKGRSCVGTEMKCIETEKKIIIRRGATTTTIKTTTGRRRRSLKGGKIFI